MKKNTWINIGFSLILFLMFVICSFFMLVFGARQYQKGIQVEQVREDTQIPLAYLSTKIHHASSSDAICLDDGVLKIQEDGYQTCIYEKNHALYEIVLKDGSDMSVGEVSMNNIYSHRSYRLYQSSYDEDGKGSVLA